MKKSALFEHDHSAYTKETDYRFRFTEHENYLQDRLCHYFNYCKGAYVFGGQRGIGKSSMVERSLLKARDYIPYLSKPKLVIRLSAYQAMANFDYFFSKKLLQEIDHQETKNISSETNEALTTLIDEFQTQVEVHAFSRDSHQKESISSNQKELGINIKDLFRFKKNNINNLQISLEEERKKVTKYVITREDKLTQLFSIINKVSINYDIIIIIDELDKISNESIIAIIEENKQLIMSNILTLFITDKNQSFYLEDFYSDYISEFLYYNTPELRDFIFKITSLEFVDDISGCLELYYQTLGNHRLIINDYYNNSNTRIGNNMGVIVAVFVQSKYYLSLNDKYKDIMLAIFREAIKHLELIKSISVDEISIIINNYISIKYNSSYTIKLLSKQMVQFLKDGINLCESQKTITSEYNYEEWNSILGIFSKKFHSLRLNLYNELTDSFEYIKITNFFYDLNEIIEESQNEAINGNDGIYIDFKKQLLEKVLKDSKVKDIIDIKNKSIHLVNRENHNSVKGAIHKLNLHSSELIGVILFDPFNNFTTDIDEKPLYNGLIVTYHNDSFIVLCYTEYPGLTSHKKKEIENLYAHVRTHKISTIKIVNDNTTQEIWDHYFENRKSVTIEELIEKYLIKEWLDILLSYNFYQDKKIVEDKVEVIY